MTLTPAEAAEPLARYFHRPLTPISAETRAALAQGAMPTGKVLPRAEINRLLDEGNHDVETGYCTLPSGVGYVAVRTPMPNVTPAMIDWWFAWHGEVPLRYKIWFPSAHFDNRVDPPLRAGAKPYWHSTHYPVEDLGMGSEKIWIHFVPPAEFGFNATPFEASDEYTAICGRVGLQQLGIEHTQMCHFVRRVAGGVEMRSRFWLGHDVRLGGVAAGQGLNRVLNQPWVKRRLIAPALPYHMAHHCAQEYAHLAAILPELYAEYGASA